MSEMKELKRFIYSATVTSGSGSQSFYIDAESREEADARAANNESNGIYADDSEITDLDALEYEDETTVDDFGDFPLISREQSLIAQLEAAQKERDALREVHIGAGSNTRAAADIYFQLVEELQVPAGGSLVGVIDNLKAELSAANEKHGWINCSDQMPDPNQQRRVCVFTPSSAADLRYRLVPANLFKAVCSSSTHWHYVNDPVEGNADGE
ncbi:hypothetical protein ACVQFJ_004114 [Yersinia enterocolitica]